MKRYLLVIGLHIAVLVLSGALLVWFYEREMIFSLVLVLLVIGGVSYHLYRVQSVQVRMVNQLMECLRTGDNLISFRSPYRNRALMQLVKELNEVTAGYRSRLLEQTEMQAWQKLIRVLTHEMMNSITPIISLSETLCEREMTHENQELFQQALKTIHRRSKSLLGFVENYRKLMRLPSPVKQSESLCKLFSELEKLFPQSFVSIHHPKTDLQLMIDRSQIEQVLINLVKNACEACENQPNPRVDVFVSLQDERKCCIDVSDNGIGILPEVQERIFVPFFTTKTNGSGIGLSLCKQIMNQHGGTIRVTSQQNHGTTFSLEFEKQNSSNTPF